MKFKKLFLNKSKSITSAAFLIGFFAFLSRILGLVRARVFAFQFGAGAELDMYYAAFRLPDLIYNLVIMGALSSVFIPVFTSYRVEAKKQEGEKHWKLANNVFHVVSSLIFIFSVGFILFAPEFIKLIAPGFNASQKATTVLLTRIMLLQPVILSISGIISGILQSFKAFFAYALAPCLYNIGIIIGALFFAPKLGTIGLALGVILGAILHLLIQLPALKRTNYHYQFIIDLKEKGLREIVRLALPRSLALGTLQINMLVITAIASTISKGSISIFNYANNIQYVPLGIIGVAFATAAFPNLSENFSKEDLKKFSKELSESVRQIIFLVVPIAIIFYVLRFEIVNIILKTGDFNLPEVWLTASCLAFFTIGIPFQSLIPLLSRSFYALHNTIKPVLINATGVGANIVFSLLFVDFLENHPQFFAPLYQFLGVAQLDGRAIIGLPLAYSLGSIVNFFLLYWFTKREITPFPQKELFKPIIKSALAGAGLYFSSQAIQALFGTQTQTLSSLVAGISAGTVGILTYLFISYLMKNRELKLILNDLFPKTDLIQWK